MASAKVETAYRIVEEALRSVEKHAQAKQVDLVVSMDRTNAATHLLKLSIKDDGKGFDPKVSKRGHFGLLGMQEQADVLGAKLKISSTFKSGTLVYLEVAL